MLPVYCIAIPDIQEIGEPANRQGWSVMRIWIIIILAFLAGCTTTPSTPPEPDISVQLKGTSVEVQNFIEERVRKNPGADFRVDSATDRAIVFKANCMDMPDMNAFKCAMIMMGVGNSGWDGPFAITTFRTAEIRGVVNLTVSTEWCAANAFGKTNCMPEGTSMERNKLLRKIKASYEQEAQASTGQ